MANAQYVIRVGHREEPVGSAAALERHIAEARARTFSDLWLVQRGSSMKGFEKFVYRALGIRSESDGPSVYVLSAPDGSALVFLDEDFNEYRVVNEHPAAAAAEVMFELSNGQKTRHPADEVIAREIAFDAVRYFFEHGVRPPSLSYREADGHRKRSARK